MSITIELDAKRLRPGGTVSGRVLLDPLPDDERRKVELSVLWETSGKGDTDIGVALFRVLADGDPVAARAEHRFEARLPALPLSYAGTLIKIDWLVRVRRLDPMGSDFVWDENFVVATEP